MQPNILHVTTVSFPVLCPLTRGAEPPAGRSVELQSQVVRSWAEGHWGSFFFFVFFVFFYYYYYYLQPKTTATLQPGEEPPAVGAMSPLERTLL